MQNWLHNLQNPGQKKYVGLLFKYYQELQYINRRVLTKYRTILSLELHVATRDIHSRSWCWCCDYQLSPHDQEVWIVAIMFYVTSFFSPLPQLFLSHMKNTRRS